MEIYLGLCKEKHSPEKPFFYSILNIINFQLQQVSTRVTVDFFPPHQWWYKYLHSTTILTEALKPKAFTGYLFRINNLSNSHTWIMDNILNT